MAACGMSLWPAQVCVPCTPLASQPRGCVAGALPHTRTRAHANTHVPQRKWHTRHPGAACMSSPPWRAEQAHVSHAPAQLGRGKRGQLIWRRRGGRLLSAPVAPLDRALIVPHIALSPVEHSPALFLARASRSSHLLRTARAPARRRVARPPACIAVAGTQASPSAPRQPVAPPPAPARAARAAHADAQPPPAPRAPPGRPRRRPLATPARPPWL